MKPRQRTVAKLRRQSVAVVDDNALGTATEDEVRLEHAAMGEIETTAGGGGRDPRRTSHGSDQARGAVRTPQRS